MEKKEEKRLKLNVSGGDLLDFTRYKVKLVVNLNGSKPSRGRNLYKKQLNRIRRILR